MNSSVSFKGTVQKFPGPDGWFYVSLPDDLLPIVLPKAEWGLVKVMATLGQTTWETSLMPMKGGGKFLALKASVRKKEKIEIGDKISVDVMLKN